MGARAPRRRAVSRASFAIIFAFLVLSTSVAATVAYQLHQNSVIATAAEKPKYLVLLILDGAEPSYFHMPGTPHLQALIDGGVQYDRAFAGILESETPSGHATIATGSTPARDGMLGFNWITDKNETVHLFDPN